MGLIDLYKKQAPATSKANIKGGDPEIIGYEDSFSPSKNLSKDEKSLLKARGGKLNDKAYTSTLPK